MVKNELNIFKKQLALEIERELELEGDTYDYETQNCYKITIRFLRTGRYSPLQKSVVEMVSEEFDSMVGVYILNKAKLN